MWLDFDITNMDDYFTVSGRATDFDLTLLNEFIGSQFYIKFKSGHLDLLGFDMYGNNYQTEGKLDLEYKKLAVEKLAKDEVYSDEQKRRGLLIGLGNMLIDHNKNRADKNYRADEKLSGG